MDDIDAKGDSYQEISLDLLRLDPLNPRLPPEAQELEEPELLRHIAERYNTAEVARSIARHGFFKSEPLIVVEDDQANRPYIAVEGNRRLVSLRILTEPDLSTGLDNEREWREIELEVSIPSTIPCVVTGSRTRVAAIIGFRHISGIEQWEAVQKARFIADLIDEQELSFQETAELVGEPEKEIRSQYRNYGIVEQGKESFSLNVERVEEDFGVFTRAMSSRPLRAHIDAPAPASVRPREWPLDDGAGDDLGELFAWLFGTEDEDPVIKDSRQITRLGRVVADEHALSVLRSTRDLEEAEDALGGTKARLIGRLQEARGALEAALEDIHEHAREKDIRGLIEECSEALELLMKKIR